MEAERQSLEDIQEATRLYALSGLVRNLRDRFLKSADLVGILPFERPEFNRPHYDERLDLTPLMPFWAEMCRRYREEIYDPQLGLLDRSDDHEAEGWSRYLYWVLIPALVEDNAIARNVMLALGLHGSAQPVHATAKLAILAKEFRLPAMTPKN
jgi:hypothetical protein